MSDEKRAADECPRCKSRDNIELESSKASIFRCPRCQIRFNRQGKVLSHEPDPWKFHGLAD